MAKKDKITLQGIADVSLLTDFLEAKGAAWGARREVISKSAIAIIETLEKVGRTQTRVWPIIVQAEFDEYNLRIEMEYRGDALVFGVNEKLDLDALLDDDDDSSLDMIVANVSGVLMQQLADKMRSRQSGQYAIIELNFEH